MKLQEHALHLPSESSESRRQPLPAGVRSIGRIMNQVLQLYGLKLDECQPQPPAVAIVSRLPHSQSVLEPMGAVSS